MTLIVIFDLPNHRPLLNEQVMKVDSFMAKHGAVRENTDIGRRLWHSGIALYSAACVRSVRIGS